MSAVSVTPNLVPPNSDPQPGFPEARAIGAALRSALETARPARVVYLSTIGAQASQPNLLTQHTIIEQALSDLPVPITFLRPAWFMENCRWDVVPAREQGRFRVSCNRSTSRCRWWPPRISGNWPLPCCKNRGAATAWWNWKDRTA